MIAEKTGINDCFRIICTQCGISTIQGHWRTPRDIRRRWNKRVKPKSDIKTCPFCGRTAQLCTVSGDGRFFIKCRDCGNKTPLFDTPKEAKDCWNKRVDTYVDEILTVALSGAVLLGERKQVHEQ